MFILYFGKEAKVDTKKDGLRDIGAGGGVGGGGVKLQHALAHATIVVLHTFSEFSCHGERCTDFDEKKPMKFQTDE